MNTLPSLRKSLFLGILGASTGFGIGCVIVAGSGDVTECGASGSHSSIDGEDCVCDSGYDWCHPDDMDDFSCCDPKGECTDNNSFYSNGLCYCDAGYEWCSPSDPDDLSCCVGGGTDSTGGKTTGTGTDSGSGGTGGTGGQECPVMYEPLPRDCNADTEGQFFCSNLEQDGSACSQAYVCQNGQWVEDWGQGDEECKFVGTEDSIAVGCVFTQDSAVVYECLTGPGTPCTPEEVPGTCQDQLNIQYCQNGRLVEDSCVSVCQQIGDGVQTFDHGECMADGNGASCFCCDIGDPGCNAGGTGTTG